MKLQNPPRVHSLYNKEKNKMVNNNNKKIVQIMFQLNPRNNWGQSHTKDGEIKFNHKLENMYI